ncbi:uncharacterized protein ACA1_033790 [Acanthamoeba castellanii str. Neff]|uniref:Uncharacterized protein n=1 Tax=Acanthamoeba castellanii (strain ATCC 30010 / Neff) TaxID=1257118 RepID=L8GHK4_ACACF|nr:uncharacterized protein ACA1_033790 [Acanthamoeba castellanii str. Neff]ELR12228.1 hypothetical protein ACA1_033790 [Acanthamoeba castellanii str. Neff]
MLPNLQLPVDTKQHDTFEYHSTIGMLSYLAHTLQPDIFFPIVYLSCFTNNFSPKHIATVKHIMCYLTSTANLAICYLCNLYDDKDVTTHIPIGYCNTNWGNIKVNCQSVSSVIFIFCRGAISWSIKTQKCITLSSTKAKLNTISKATHQALYAAIRSLKIGLKGIKQHIKAIKDAPHTDNTKQITDIMHNAKTHIATAISNINVISSGSAMVTAVPHAPTDHVLVNQINDIMNGVTAVKTVVDPLQACLNNIMAKVQELQVATSHEIQQICVKAIVELECVPKWHNNTSTK